MVSEYINSDDIKPLVIECIDRLKLAGAIPKVLVADQGSPHQRLFTLLGASIDKPYFDHCSQGDSIKIFTMWDTPHLLKSLRNNLMSVHVMVAN